MLLGPPGKVVVVGLVVPGNVVLPVGPRDVVEVVVVLLVVVGWFRVVFAVGDGNGVEVDGVNVGGLVVTVENVGGGVEVDVGPGPV